MTIELALRVYTDICINEYSEREKSEVRQSLATDMSLTEAKEFFESCGMIEILRYSLALQEGNGTK